MAACKLYLYEKNIFRVTELPVDATAKDVSRQAQKQQMLAEMGSNTAAAKTSFALLQAPDEDQVREALARMKTPEDRFVDEFFWFWPEEFGKSSTDPAIQAILSGNSDQAAKIWREREKEDSFTAIHNLAVMFHMTAIDWTIHQLTKVIAEKDLDEIKGYWQRSFERWEKVAEMEEIWDCMKGRVKSMNDEALTTGFVRRFRDELPMALDRVNAEAALAFAEKRDMEWAKYHVRLMNETHQGLDDVEATAELVLEPTRKRVRQYLNSAEQEGENSPERGAELAMHMLSKCKPSLEIYDLFHGKEVHQRADLFDEVASIATSLAIGYQLETEDDIDFVKVLNTALDFASGASVREKIIHNISIGEDNLESQKFKPIFDKLKHLSESDYDPKQRLKRVKVQILPLLPSLAQASENDSKAFNALVDSIAITLREISIASHNEENDVTTAESAIQIALRLAKSVDLKTRLRADAAEVNKSVQDSACHFCGSSGCKPETSLDISMFGEVTRSYEQVNFRTTTIRIPRCKVCERKHSEAGKLGCGLALIAIFVGALFGGARNWGGGMFVGCIVGLLIHFLVTTIARILNGYNKFHKYPAIVTMTKKGWQVGDKPG